MDNEGKTFKTLLTVLLLLFLSCVKKQDEASKRNNFVPLNSQTHISQTKFASQTALILNKFNSANRTSYSIDRIFVAPVKSSGWLGYCSDGTIFIDPSNKGFVFASVLIHELGHCALGLNHDSGMTVLGNKKNIMHPSSSGLSPLKIQFYLENMRNQNDSAIDTIGQREGINASDDFIIGSKANVLINPDCHSVAGAIVCPENSMNLINFSDSAIYGFSRCGGNNFYIRDLSQHEENICSEWEDLIYGI